MRLHAISTQSPLHSIHLPPSAQSLGATKAQPLTLGMLERLEGIVKVRDQQKFNVHQGREYLIGGVFILLVCSFGQVACMCTLLHLDVSPLHVLPTQSSMHLPCTSSSSSAPLASSSAPLASSSAPLA